MTSDNSRPTPTTKKVEAQRGNLMMKQLMQKNNEQLQKLSMASMEQAAQLQYNNFINPNEINTMMIKQDPYGSFTVNQNQINFY